MNKLSEQLNWTDGFNTYNNQIATEIKNTQYYIQNFSEELNILDIK